MPVAITVHPKPEASMDLSSIGGGLLSVASARMGQLFNSSEAEKNRNWQTEMSNTAHQREVKDLKAAGLNPVLSANGGAAVGSGATASASAPDIAGAVTNARQASTARQGVDQQKQLLAAQINNLHQQSAKTNAEARSAAVTAALDEKGAKAVEKYGPAAKTAVQLMSLFKSQK